MIDTRLLMEFEPTSWPRDARVLLVDYEGESIGLLVEAPEHDAYVPLVGTVRRLERSAALVGLLAQDAEPLRVDLDVAEAGTCEFAAQFVLVGFGLVLSVDVGLKQVHQDVEYVFFHAWSVSLNS